LRVYSPCFQRNEQSSINMSKQTCTSIISYNTYQQTSHQISRLLTSIRILKHVKSWKEIVCSPQSGRQRRWTENWNFFFAFEMLQISDCRLDYACLKIALAFVVFRFVERKLTHFFSWFLPFFSVLQNETKKKKLICFFKLSFTCFEMN
jgi:hypothetical protein